MKDPNAVSLGRRGGLKGGHARAAALTPQQRSEAARKAARARWNTQREKPLTLSEIKEAAAELGHNDSLVLVIAAFVVGTRPWLLTLFTGFDPDWICDCAERMEENGLWINGRAGLEDPADDETLWVEVCLHALVAEGFVQRVPA